MFWVMKLSIKNYTAFDVETANNSRDSICSIGIVRVENNEVVFAEEILINPECDFNFFNTRIHGINQEMVSDKPTFPQVWDKISRLFSDTVLVAHNAKSMDLCALCRTLEKYNLTVPKIKYICTYELAKELISKSECGAYRLDVLCNKFKINLNTHHNALDDAMACKDLLEHFKNCNPESIESKPYYFSSSNSDCDCYKEHKTIYSNKTLAMQEFQQIIISVLSDGFVSDKEATALLSWMKTHSDLKGYYPFDKLFDTVDTILIDMKVDNEEEKILLEILDAFVSPQTSEVKAEINGKSICLSGDFVFGSKKDVENYLTSRGAVVVSSVTKKVDILILGESGSAAWKYGNYGSKYEKATQLNEKGASIIIYKEKDILGD